MHIHRRMRAVAVALLAVPLIAAGSDATVSAAYDCDGLITVTAEGHALSNIVIVTAEGEVKVEDPFQSVEDDVPDPELFSWTFDPAEYGEVETLYVKAGNNGFRGRGAEAVPAPAEDCGPVLGTGDVQVTLEFTSTPPESVDMDLYVIDPAGERIAYYNPTSASGGELDRDDDVCGTTDDGFSVENVFWADGTAPTGTYTVGVDQFSICGDNTGGAASWTLTVRVGGVVVLSESGVGDDDPAATEAGPSNTFTFEYPTPLP